MMIHGDTKKDEPLPANDSGNDVGVEEHDEDLPSRRPKLGRLKTEEEDRLAAEIEKLRRSG